MLRHRRPPSSCRLDHHSVPQRLGDRGLVRLRAIAGLLAAGALVLALSVLPRVLKAADLVPPGPAVVATAALLKNASRPTRCAEEDNVDVRFAGSAVTSFTVAAEHPAYIGSLTEDSTAPDFTACDFSADPAYTFVPRTITLYNDDRLQLVGRRFASNWRPGLVPLAIDGQAHEGVHLIQVFDKSRGRAVEVLVLYPSDGYWRAKPLPPAGLADSAYGSSFLIGPIEEQGRPLVVLSRVAFDPGASAFTLSFARGGEATVRLAEASPVRTLLAVALAAVSANHPFAALRSMFVDERQADAAETHWQQEPGGSWQARPIMAPLATDVAAARFTRTVPSRHNTSAPDLLFADFARHP